MCGALCPRHTPIGPALARLYILQRGMQWKQGVVIYMTLYTSLLYNTTPIHCTPDPQHPPSAEYPSARDPRLRDRCGLPPPLLR